MGAVFHALAPSFLRQPYTIGLSLGLDSCPLKRQETHSTSSALAPPTARCPACPAAPDSVRLHELMSSTPHLSSPSLLRNDPAKTASQSSLHPS